MTRASCLRTAQGERIALVGGLRSPFARQASAYLGLPAVELGRQVVDELIWRTGVDPAVVDLLVFGQVIQMPAAPNIAREIVLGSQLDVATDAYSVSRACATSFQAVANVAEAMLAGRCQVGIAGGADSSSVLPVGVTAKLAQTLLLLNKARTLPQRLRLLSQLRLADFKPVAPAVAEYSTGLSMGQSAEQMAQRHGIGREEQDAFAHRSHTLAAAAWERGDIAEEVAPILCGGRHEPLLRDNCIRFDSDEASYRRLKPVFDRQYGTVTAANASPMTDGAAALLLMTETRAAALGFTPLAFLRSYAFAGLPVQQDMLLGPTYAIPQALARGGCQLSDMALVEMHEAFAAQVLCNLKLMADERFARDVLRQERALGEVDPERFNVLGGSLAYGHPFAATGARMILQTVRELRRRGGGLGLTTACAAGGLGVAMIWEVAE